MFGWPKHIGKKTAFRKIPVLLFHVVCRRRQPQHTIRAVGAPSVEPAAGADLRKAAAYFAHMSDKIDEVATFVARAFPANPAGLVILAIGVVIAVLGIADLVAGQDQGNALGEQKAGELIFPQLVAQRVDGGIVGRAFVAAIVAVIVVGAVAVVLAVRLIVLGVVAEEVVERETVMHRDVIDAGALDAPVMVEEIGRAGHTAGDFADQAAFAAPIAAQRAAIAVVPFRPLRRKTSDLVAAHAEIPGFGDQLDGSQHRVLANGGEEGGVAIKTVRAAAERRGEIEPEAVD